MRSIRPLRLLFFIFAIGLLLTVSIEGSAKTGDAFGTPKYGGTIIHRTTVLGALNIDPYSPGFENKQRFFFEFLFQPNWALDRNTWPFQTMWVPSEYFTGGLAESWEQTSPVTVTLKIRKGVYWQKKAPVNGREFTAEDVKFNFDRNLGLGSGFSTPSPLFGNTFSNVKSVEVIDKYTAVINLKQPSAMFINVLMNSGFPMVAEEWAKLGPPPGGGGGPGGPGGGPGGPPGGGPGGPPGGGGGPGGPGGGPGGPPGGGGGPGGPGGGGAAYNYNPLDDWHLAVGTGPWMVTDFVRGTSMTFVKNPNYWGFDERHPENRLPYADELREVAINDWATTVAALRTGKIDIISDKDGPTRQLVDAVKKSNPKINVAWWPSDGFSVILKYGVKPFDDIRVRKAMSMALNIPLIAKTHLGGLAKGEPAGKISPAFKGWTTPFQDWPADLKAEYTYNPEGAKKLLTEAGYPKGFKTNCVTASQWDVDLLQIIKAQFKDVGIDMDIKRMDFPAWMGIAMQGKYDQMTYANHCGQTGLPTANLAVLVSGEMPNHGFVNDPKYNEMYKQLLKSVNIEDAKKLSREMDMYALRQHFEIETLQNVTASLWQPWIIGLSGEFLQPPNFYYARVWLDQGIKKSMGK